MDELNNPLASPIHDMDEEMVEYLRKAMAANDRLGKYIEQLNETGAIVYIDNDGHLIKRTPDGDITRFNDKYYE